MNARHPHITEAQIEADERVPVVRITRDFHATPEQLLKAHTDPELFARWVGPDSLTTEVTTWDARDGGEWRFVQREGSDEHRFRGCFHTVSSERLVQTFTWEGMPDGVSLDTTVVEDLGDGWTRLHSTSLLGSFEDRDGMLASGMESGIHEGYAKLDRLLADASV